MSQSQSGSSIPCIDKRRDIEVRAQEYQTMREVEDSHWWYHILRGLTVEALASRLENGAAVLDAGCGTGGTLAVLRDAGHGWRLSGFDLAPEAVELTRARGFTDVRIASVDEPPRDDACQDAIVSLDVLYFRGVDRPRAMAGFHRALKPGGVLVMNLAAFECLRGSHDVAVSTGKRFTRGEVIEMLREAGFEVEVVHYWNAWLFAPIFVWRQASRLFVGRDATEVASDLSSPPAVLNRALIAMGRLDARLSRWLRIPFGTSVFCVASKRKTK